MSEQVAVSGQPAAVSFRIPNATPLLNRKEVKRLILDTAAQLRPFNKFNRVSKSTLVDANAALRAWCVSRVKAAPSKGVTL